MPTAEVKGCLVSIYHLAPQISEAFLVFLVAEGQMLVKRHPLIHLTDYALSLSLSACFFTHSLRDVLARRRDSSKTPRPYSLCPKVSNTNGKLLSPNHLWSLPAALTLTLLLVGTRGLFQDMMFERLRDSTFSEDASEVIVQPLPCGTSLYWSSYCEAICSIR